MVLRIRRLILTTSIAIDIAKFKKARKLACIICFEFIPTGECFQMMIIKIFNNRKKTNQPIVSGAGISSEIPAAAMKDSPRKPISTGDCKKLFQNMLPEGVPFMYILNRNCRIRRTKGTNQGDASAINL